MLLGTVEQILSVVDAPSLSEPLQLLQTHQSALETELQRIRSLLA
jgi:hypothetical protein